jgi:TetR/AcrR family transcriptional repressor of lmrAB and yxaGH operons
MPTMPAPPKHRNAIIQAAATLFRRRGYSATGLNDIVKLSGAPKGSLYHYFPNGKASIAEAAVRHAASGASRTLEELAREQKTAAGLVRAYASLLAKWLAKSGFADGSSITTTLLEMTPGDKAVTKAGLEAYATWRRILALKLIGEGVPSGRADPLAALAIAAIEGSLIHARVECSGKVIELIAREVGCVLDAAVGEAASRRSARRIPKRKRLIG